MSVLEKKGAFSQLKIEEAELIDQGWYKCQFGIVSKTSIKVFLKVLKPENDTTTPSITSKPTTLAVSTESSR
jgi:hypothetical protein